MTGCSFVMTKASYCFLCFCVKCGFPSCARVCFFCAMVFCPLIVAVFSSLSMFCVCFALELSRLWCPCVFYVSLFLVFCCFAVDCCGFVTAVVSSSFLCRGLNCGFLTKRQREQDELEGISWATAMRVSTSQGRTHSLY